MEIKLGKVSIPIAEYASQGNAILGIRDSGKSYTATYIAERLMDAGIPFVAFDPIGIWKYLRVAGKKAGYPVVVAGGRNADLPLTPQSAPEIVRAAMRDNIPLVIDLYDIKLSKADWKSIVEQCVRLLLYENGDYGLRHIFIEEAAEFAPQRIGPDQGRVYAEIEKLARMGGNAQLGYTIINQRSEEVNKAVLELCDCLFLHRQKGRNSLTALSKWLDIGSVNKELKIVESLPLLPQGDCWVWKSGSDIPERVHVPHKNTFHPDRRSTTRAGGQPSNFAALDVSKFVTQMSLSLEKHLEQIKENDPSVLKKRIAELSRQLAQGEHAQAVNPTVEKVEVPIIDKELYDSLVATFKRADEKLKEIQNQQKELYAAFSVELDGILSNIQKPFEQLESAFRAISGSSRHAIRSTAILPDVKTAQNQIRHTKYQESQPMGLEGRSQLAPSQQKIIDSLAWLESVGLYNPKRVIVAFLSGASPKSSTFVKNLSKLCSYGFISYPDSESLKMETDGRSIAKRIQIPLDSASLQMAILSKLPPSRRRILECLVQAGGDAVSREELAERCGVSPKSSTFVKNMSALRSLGVIHYPDTQSAAALPILWI